MEKGAFCNTIILDIISISLTVVPCCFIRRISDKKIGVADPRSGVFLTSPGSRNPGQVFFWLPDLGTRIPNPFLAILVTIFWVKSTRIGLNFSLTVQNIIIFSFEKFVATKKIRLQKNSPLLFCCCCWIRDPGQIKIRIRICNTGKIRSRLNSD